MTFRLAVLPGDGIGPEVTRAALRVLDAVADAEDLDIAYSEFKVGGAAIDAYGMPLRSEDLERCSRADAVLLGAVGGPAWDDMPVETRPERALLRLRSELGLSINLRPVQWTAAGASRSPLRPEIAEGADIAFVRELTGGVYFGRPSYVQRTASGRHAVDTGRYTEQQVVQVLDFAFALARSRRSKVTSVDKANVMNTSRMWRSVATEYGKEHPDVELEHVLVDSFAMSLMQEPRRFDVVATENLFGDILTDLASVIAGSLGLLPSASLQPRPAGRRFGLYEPVHGSAPGIAGQNIANPVGCILSLALMLEWSFERPDLASQLRNAVGATIAEGSLTADLATGEHGAIGTDAFVDTLLRSMFSAASSVSFAGGGTRGRRDLRHYVA